MNGADGRPRTLEWVGLFLLAAALVSGPAGGQAAGPTPFEDTYENLTPLQLNGGSCGTTYHIEGLAPSDTGAYPVFVYLRGTVEFFRTPASVAAVEAMARRGFVAARLDYPNEIFGECRTLEGRARCAFEGSRPGSALGVLCDRPSADCEKGVVVAGFSQGSVLSLLAHDYDTRVRAVYGLGTGVNYTAYDLRACVAERNRSLPADRLRAVTGEADDFLGARPDRVRRQLESLTGLACGDTAVACARPDGSGWALAPGARLADGRADHCYMNRGELMECLWTGLDPAWRTTRAPWGMNHNLDWLVRRLESDLVDDRLEPNDGFDSAVGLVDGTYRALSARDEDVYVVRLDGGETLRAEVSSPAGSPTPVLSLHDSTHRRVSSANGGSDTGAVRVRKAVAGPYFLRVKPVDGSSPGRAPYTLEVATANRGG